MRVHRPAGGDSGHLVKPFMHADFYSARHMATLRESELLPAFTGPSPGWTRASGTGIGQASSPVHTLAGSRGTMFLLNSRAPLVTATCGPGLSPRNAGTPSPEVTGPICRVPSPALGPTGLGLLSQRTCVGSRYGHRGSLPTPFSRSPGIGRRPLIGAPITPSAASHHYGSPRPSVLGRVEDLGPPPLGLARGVRGGACVAAYPGGAGILTGFPFGGYQLGAALGPANRRLTKHCRRTLALSAVGILTPLRCYYRRDLQHTPVHRSSRPGFRPVCAPAYPVPSSEDTAGVSAPGFSPDSFSGPPSSAGELLRTL